MGLTNRNSSDEIRTRLRRDHESALLALARERAVTNALRLAAASSGEADPPNFPHTTGPGEPPLRYVIADKANAGLKVLTEPIHQMLREIVRASKQGR